MSYSDPTGAIGGWLKTVVGVVAAVAAAAVVVSIAVAAAPAAICLVTTGLELIGVSAEAATAIATIGAMTTASSAAIFTADDAYAGVTGESYLLEHVYHGNTRAYETEHFLSTVLFYGYMNAAYYGQASGVCFVAGTLINTEDGLQTIESINTGDLVWAWDENTGEVALKPVVATYINECYELIHLSVNDEVIICTPNHPFYVPQKGWTEAVRLRAGDILVTVNGEYVVLEKVQHELLEAPVTVYNFQVEDYHTYYVGESGIRVHNDCQEYTPIREGKIRAVVNPGELERPHAHIFIKSTNVGRVFADGTMDRSLLNNDDAMRFVKAHYKEIMELIREYYGKR